MKSIERKEQIAAQLIRLKRYSKTLLNTLDLLAHPSDISGSSSELELNTSLDEVHERLAQTGECIIFFLLRYEQAGASPHDLSQILGVAEHKRRNMFLSWSSDTHNRTDFPSLVYVHQLERECNYGNACEQAPFLAAMESYLKRKTLATTLTYGPELERRRRQKLRPAVCH